jgi:arylsulfatase A-like enzyme
LGLALVLAAARFWVLHLAGRATPARRLLWPWLPVALYQDVLLLALLCWGIWGLLRFVQHSTVRRLIRWTAATLCLVAATYAALSAEIYRFLKTPVTFRLLALSDHLRGVRTSIAAATTTTRLIAIAAAPLTVIVLTAILPRLKPAWLRATARRIHSRAGAAGLAAYLFAAHVASATLVADSTAVANPHLQLLCSLWDREDPFLSGGFQPDDLRDFLPLSEREPTSTAQHLPSSTGRAFDRSTSQHLNVLMVVMESVGARYVELCGAPYHNTPELVRLAEHGVTFDRMYASHPFTSNAMAGLFCSVYPYHGWRALPPRAPALRVSGLADVLAERGYRTAFLHTGDLRFDREGEFLRRHGFAQVTDVAEPSELIGTNGAGGAGVDRFQGAADFDSLPDSLLVSAARNWIEADRSRPFLLTLWTIETHHPYAGDATGNVTDPYMDRYLNAVRTTDALIGRLARELDSHGLADSTLLVVLGDHGDAFGQHGHRAHGQTLYEDEVRIPVLLVNPRLFPRGERIHRVGQQIDIGPTVLDLLGVPAPRQWQGTSLFATSRSDRAYLFTGFHHYLFGVVEGQLKYLYDATSDRRELYDLADDPDERRNLIRSPKHRAIATQAHRRLAAWLSYQNRYLSAFMDERRLPVPSP